MSIKNSKDYGKDNLIININKPTILAIDDYRISISKQTEDFIYPDIKENE